MVAPEGCITFKPEAFGPGGEVRDPELAEFLTMFMSEFRDYVARVLTVLPRDPA